MKGEITMRVDFTNGVLTVVTDISKETIEKGIASLKVSDDKKGELFRVEMSKDGKASIDNYSLTCNQFVDGKAAAIVVTKEGTTLADVQKQYGKALVEAGKYTGIIASKAQEEEAAIAGMFAAQE